MDEPKGEVLGKAEKGKEGRDEVKGQNEDWGRDEVRDDEGNDWGRKELIGTKRMERREEGVE